jgi:hypothetical protein
MDGACSTHGEIRVAYKTLVGKTKKNKQLERPRRRWEDGIKMDLKKIGWEVVDLIHLAQDRD